MFRVFFFLLLLLTFAVNKKHNSDVDLIVDLAAEHLRDQPLIVYVTQRTLEFVRYAMLKSLNLITWGDDDVLVTLVKGTGGLFDKVSFFCPCLLRFPSSSLSAEE